MVSPEATLNLLRNKRIASAIIIALAFPWFYIEYKGMTSKFNLDRGNGIFIRGDRYVETGEWLFNCKRGTVVSLSPLPIPVDQLIQTKSFEPNMAIYLDESEKITANLVIDHVTSKPDWYTNLKYAHSTLGESSELVFHLYISTTEYEGRLWLIKLLQVVKAKNHPRFYIGSKPYDPATFIDHEKAIQQARASCPTPQ